MLLYWTVIQTAFHCYFLQVINGLYYTLQSLLINLICFLAGCHKRQLNQLSLVLSGLVLSVSCVCLWISCVYVGCCRFALSVDWLERLKWLKWPIIGMFHNTHSLTHSISTTSFHIVWWRLNCSNLTEKNYTYFTLPCRGLGVVRLVDWPTVVLQCLTLLVGSSDV